MTACHPDPLQKTSAATASTTASSCRGGNRTSARTSAGLTAMAGTMTEAPTCHPDLLRKTSAATASMTASSCSRSPRQSARACAHLTARVVTSHRPMTGVARAICAAPVRTAGPIPENVRATCPKCRTASVRISPERTAADVRPRVQVGDLVGAPYRGAPLSFFVMLYRNLQSGTLLSMSLGIWNKSHELHSQLTAAHTLSKVNERAPHSFTLARKPNIPKAPYDTDVIIFRFQ